MAELHSRMMVPRLQSGMGPSQHVGTVLLQLQAGQHDQDMASSLSVASMLEKVQSGELRVPGPSTSS